MKIQPDGSVILSNEEWKILNKFASAYDAYSDEYNGMTQDEYDFMIEINKYYENNIKKDREN